MQEETTQKTIALAIKTSKLTASVLQKAMKMYLEHQKHKEPSHGKIPVKKLVGQGAGAKSIEVTDDNIKAFERVARKYNVDFAVKRDKTTEPPKYLVFFKGKDADVIAQAFKEFVKVNEKKQQRPSLRQKLKGLQKMIAQNKNRERSSTPGSFLKTVGCVMQFLRRSVMECRRLRNAAASCICKRNWKTLKDRSGR